MKSEPPSNVIRNHKNAQSSATRLLDHGGPTGAPLLVCLHGFGGSASNWSLLAPNLTHRYRVLAPDLLGHGLTTATTAPAVADVLHQIETIVTGATDGADKGCRVVLVGNSFGASMALLLAAQNPELVDAVVVLDAPVPKRPDWRRDPAMTLKRWLISLPGISGMIYRRTTSMSPLEVVEAQLRSAGIDPQDLDAQTLHEAVALQEERHHDRPGHDAQQHLLRSLLKTFERGKHYCDQTANVSAPVLWLHGEADPMVPEPEARDFVRRHPGWTYRTRPETGHVPQLTDPSWVASSIDSWISTLPPKTPGQDTSRPT